MNQYELAIETLDMYFPTPRAVTLEHLPDDPQELVDYLKGKGADKPEERVQAIEFAFGGEIGNRDKIKVKPPEKEPASGLEAGK